eukprot:m.160778 g.160778  ORF g.160778 m.160778 type:complete len:971 (+) comp16510_c0_seq8:89-3001(+)
MIAVGTVLVCEFAFEPEIDDELLLEVNDRVTILPNVAPEEDADLWLTGKNHRTAQVGLFPAEGYCIPLAVNEQAAIVLDEDLALPEAIVAGTTLSLEPTRDVDVLAYSDDDHDDVVVEDEEDFIGFGEALPITSSLGVVLLDNELSSSEADGAPENQSAVPSSLQTPAHMSESPPAFTYTSDHLPPLTASRTLTLATDPGSDPFAYESSTDGPVLVPAPLEYLSIEGFGGSSSTDGPEQSPMSHHDSDDNDDNSPPSIATMHAPPRNPGSFKRHTDAVSSSSSAAAIPTASATDVMISLDDTTSSTLATPTAIRTIVTHPSPSPPTTSRGLTFVTGHARAHTTESVVESSVPGLVSPVALRHREPQPDEDIKRESVLSQFDFPAPPGFTTPDGLDSGRVTPILDDVTAPSSPPQGTLTLASPPVPPPPELSSVSSTDPSLSNNPTSTPQPRPARELMPTTPTRRPNGRSVIVYDTPTRAEPVRKGLLARVVSVLSPRRSSMTSSPAQSSPKLEVDAIKRTQPQAPGLAMTSFGLDGVATPADTSDSLQPLRYHSEATVRQKNLGVNLSARRVEIPASPNGYGFAINGESPVFVRSVVRKGPSDNGLNGLLINDIILKVNGEACPLGPRARVVELIKATPPDQPLRMVVCRTPTPARRTIPPTGNLSEANVPPTTLLDSSTSTTVTVLDMPLGPSEPRASTPPNTDTATPVLSPLFKRPAFGESSQAVPVSPPQAPSPSQLTHTISFDTAANSNESHNNSFVAEPADEHIHRLHDVSEAVFSGWLLKLSAVMHVTTRWKRRYVLLFDHRMAYFKSAHPNAKPCAVMDLRQCSIQRTKVEGLLYTFRIVSREHKPLHLQVVNKRMFGNWLERIESIRQQALFPDPPVLSNTYGDDNANEASTMAVSTVRPISLNADQEFASMLNGLNEIATKQPEPASNIEASSKPEADVNGSHFAVTTIALSGHEFAETCI